MFGPERKGKLMEVLPELERVRNCDRGLNTSRVFQWPSKKFFTMALLFWLAMIPSPSRAQEEARNFIGASFGGSDFHIKDDHASPMIFSRLGIAPSLQYFFRGEANRQYAEISYYHGYLGTTADNYHDTDNRARVRYSYFHSIVDFTFLGQRISLFVGGSANSFMSHSDYYYLYVQGTEARTIESWQWSTSLDLSFQLECALPDREFLSAQFFMPMVSNASRPQYSPGGDYNYVLNDWKYKMFGTTELFPENFSLNSLLVYQRPLRESLDVELSYEFYYSFYNRPQDIGMYMNNFRAGFIYTF